MGGPLTATRAAALLLGSLLSACSRGNHDVRPVPSVELPLVPSITPPPPTPPRSLPENSPPMQFDPLGPPGLDDGIAWNQPSLDACAPSPCTHPYEIEVEVAIDADGAVTKAKVSKGEPSLRPCIEKKLRKWFYPRAPAPRTVQLAMRLHCR